MNKQTQKQIEELNDMVKLVSLLLSVDDDVRAELFEDVMRNLEEKEPWYTNLSEVEQNEYIESMCKNIGLKKLEKYAENLRKKYGEYVDYSFNGKNGADSENEKGFWRGMATSVLGFLNDLHKLGLISKVGLFGDKDETTDKL